MESEHGRLRRLVLGIEDLDGASREEALAHLEQCPECRRLRDQVLAAEAVIRSVGLLPEAPSVADPAADASLEALLGTVPRSRFTPFRMVPLALAAVLALALVALGPLVRSSGPVRELRIGSPLVLRGNPADATDLQQGVSFRMARTGYPVLVHVDGAGNARLLYPAPGEVPALYREGELVLLPPPESARDWRAGLAPGCETYLLSVTEAAAPPGSGSLELLRFGASAGPRPAAVEATRRRLDDAFGNVAVRNHPDCP